MSDLPAIDRVSEEGLVAAYILDGQGGARPVNWPEIERWSPDQGILWAHLDYEHPAARQHIEKLPDLPELATELLMLDETRPRCDPINHGLLIVLRAVNTNPGADPDDMVALRMWLEPSRIITSRRRPLRSIQAMRDAFEQNRGPVDAGSFLAQFVDRLNDRIAGVIDDLEESIDGIEEAIAAHDTPVSELRGDLSILRRQSARLRRYLAPQRDALERLHRDTHPVLDNSDRLDLREETDRLRRYVEDLDLARERALVAHEQIQTHLSEQQNQRIYVLSIVAAIFLPLSFVTGLLGMNVGGIPGEGVPTAFNVLVIGMLVIAGALIALFRRKKWL